MQGWLVGDSCVEWLQRRWSRHCESHGRMLTGFEMGHFLKKFVEFGGHGVLSSDKVELIGSEFRDGLFDVVHSGLGTSRLSHGAQ